MGKQIYLRGLCSEDLTGQYFSWMNDQEVTRWLCGARFPNSAERMNQFLESTPSDCMCSIVLKDSDAHIGNVRLHNINFIHGTADLEKHSSIVANMEIQF
ncbi:MAG TPA: GNAT family N-acetyltransferase [Oculatellaceae cyanobacterium]